MIAAREYSDLGEKINAVDFDHVFRIADGGVVDVPGLYAPDVYHDDTDDVDVQGDGWACITGMTGQYGYHGAVMHPSEFIGGGIAALLAEMADEAREDGHELAFAAVVVTDLDVDTDTGEDDAIGWAIAYRTI